MNHFTPSRGRGKTVTPRKESQEKAETVYSFKTHSSASIRRNKLRTKREVAKLDDEVENAEHEVYTLTVKVKSLEEQIEKDKTLATPELLKTLEDKLRESRDELQISKHQLKLLKKKNQRRKEILLEEEEIENEELMEQHLEDDAEEYEDHDNTVLDRTAKWAENQNTENLEENDGTREVPNKGPRDTVLGADCGVPNVQYHQPQVEVQQLATGIRDLLTSPRYSPEEIQLPIFDGKPEDWPLFFQEFERINKMIRPSQMLPKLRNSLKADAYDLVKRLFTKPENIPKIMENLEEMYGQPQFVLEALAEIAKSAPSPNRQKPETMIKFGIAVSDLVSTIESYQESSYLLDTGLIKTLTRKLPADYADEWIQWILMDSTRKQDLVTFAKWVNMKMKVASCYRSMQGAPESKEAKPKRSGHVGAISEEDATVSRSISPDKPVTRKYGCSFCHKENHKIQECQKFANLSPEERFKAVKDLGLCFSCLFWGHRTFKCRNKTNCGVKNCTLKHHPLIHEERKEDLPESDGKDPEESKKTTGHIGFVTNSNGDAPEWYLPVRVREKEGAPEHLTYVMYDSGSVTTFVDSKLANLMKISGPEEVGDYYNFRGETTSGTIQKVKFQIAGDFPGAKFWNLNPVNAMEGLNLPQQTLDIAEARKRYPNLKGAPLKSQKNAKALILLGRDNLRFMAPKTMIKGAKEGDPMAWKTSLGWFLASEGATSNRLKGVFHIRRRKDEELEQLFRNYFCLDNFGVNESPTIRSKEDVKAMKIMEATTKRVENRWETGLLWREKNPVIPESKEAALRRLYGIEKKMDKDRNFAELCTQKFQEYIEKGYLREESHESKNDENKTSGHEWYLPHFFAYHPEKKPRLVFDAAAKSNGKCFNDFFYTGPDNLRPLPEVLMKFRKHKIGLIGDITAMFHQVNLRKEDQTMQKILYRGTDRSSPPKDYVMTPLFFGSVCSPSSAIYVKDRNAKEFQDQYPHSVKKIVEETYMDDFLSGADTPEDTKRLQREVTWIHKQGGFPIAKWNCNLGAVMDQIPDEIKVTGDKEFQKKDDARIEKTLGLLWNPEDDHFTFKLNTSKLAREVMEGTRSPTKREVASFVMSLFDPLGFITPLKIQGQRIFQETWRRQKDEPVLEWNDPIPENLARRWKQWLQVLERTLTEKAIQIPRCIRSSANDKTVYQIHTFVDASEEAYSTAIYLRSETNGNIEVHFVCGKGRVAPIKGLTVPRMELNAALMGARLCTAVQKAYQEELEIKGKYYWSDSKTVMAWINSESGRFSQYVSNRINEICTLSNPQQWRWVPTKENAADDATRTVMEREFTSDCRWLKGSEFLMEQEENWPNQKVSATRKEDLEEKPVVMYVSKKRRLPLPDASDYSIWWPLIRKTARWISAFNGIRRLGKKKTLEITREDLEAAEKLWCKQVQIDAFSTEYRSLKKGEPVDKTSRLYKLSPALKDGLIVLKGRIGQASNVSDSVRNPIILDPNHPYTRLLLKHYHVTNAHQGQETVVNNIRKKYHVLECRSAVKGAITRCGTCKIARAKPAEQVMGEVPEGRIAIRELLFTHTGVDLFGPMTVKIGRRNEKRWGLLFTCLTTRAVSLDLVPSCNTSDFMDCLIRFNARKGPVKHLYSDNATNFKGTNNEIKRCMEGWNHKKLKEDLLKGSTQSKIGPEWHFNAPASPHMGGSWERLIGLTKKILVKLITERVPREYTLLTALAEVENILNSRPLSSTSPDPKDPECLTPNHILKLKVVPGQFIPGEYTDEIPRKMWRYGQRIAEEFWERWTLECLPLLLPRKKWAVDQPAIRKGDIVFLIDDQADRSDWKKGVVDSTITGPDGKVRVVDVRVPIMENGKFHKFVLYRRHLNKICPLGVNVMDKTSSYGRENVEDSSG